jgi:hypothetical protein
MSTKIMQLQEEDEEGNPEDGGQFANQEDTYQNQQF